MKSSIKIQNVRDLNLEIARVKLRQKEQEGYLSDQYRLLKNKIEAPARFISRIVSFAPGGGVIKGLIKSIRNSAQSKDADWLTKVLQIGTPFVLNSTILKKSGWLKKGLVLLASETAVGKVNKENLSEWVHKVTDFLNPKKKKKKKKTMVEPPREAAMSTVYAQEPS